MDFINLLEHYKNKSDKNKKQKEEKYLMAFNDLKKLKSNERQKLLNKHLDKWNDTATRRKIKDKFVELYL